MRRERERVGGGVNMSRLSSRPVPQFLSLIEKHQLSKWVRSTMELPGHSLGPGPAELRYSDFVEAREKNVFVSSVFVGTDRTVICFK